MKQLTLSIALCILFTSCAQNEHFNRGYVISKSHLEEEKAIPIDEKASSSTEMEETDSTE